MSSEFDAFVANYCSPDEEEQAVHLEWTIRFSENRDFIIMERGGQNQLRCEIRRRQNSVCFDDFDVAEMRKIRNLLSPLSDKPIHIEIKEPSKSYHRETYSKKDLENIVALEHNCDPSFQYTDIRGLVHSFATWDKVRSGEHMAIIEEGKIINETVKEKIRCAAKAIQETVGPRTLFFIMKTKSKGGGFEYSVASSAKLSILESHSSCNLELIEKFKGIEDMSFLRFRESSTSRTVFESAPEHQLERFARILSRLLEGKSPSNDVKTVKRVMESEFVSDQFRSFKVHHAHKRKYQFIVYMFCDNSDKYKNQRISLMQEMDPKDITDICNALNSLRATDDIIKEEALAVCAEDNALEQLKIVDEAIGHVQSLPGVCAKFFIHKVVCFSIHSNHVDDESFKIIPPCDYCQSHFFSDLSALDLGKEGDPSMPTTAIMTTNDDDH